MEVILALLTGVASAVARMAYALPWLQVAEIRCSRQSQLEALLIAQFARLPHGHAGMNETGKDNHPSRPHVHLGHSHSERV